MVAVKIFFLDINIPSAELGNVRVTVTKIMAETHVQNFPQEGGLENDFLRIMA